MPHKHTRKARDKDQSNYDLPPSTVARSLPVSKTSRAAVQKANRLDGKRRQKSKDSKVDQSVQDDTPKAFARLLKYQATGRKPQGLDNGDNPPSARKRKHVEISSSKPKEQTLTEQKDKMQGSSAANEKDTLRIRPGERMADFSARVNQALPISGLTRTAKQLRSAGLGTAVKERQTKTEKRIQKMQAEWRKEEAKRKEREEEARDEAEAEEEQVWGVEGRMSKKERRGARKEVEDAWSELKSKREQRRGLHDVVQAPPELTRTPKELLKIKNGAKVDVANVPTSAGSLKRREELGNARREVIQRYREMMQQKRDES